jgi:hypothetical protein
MSKISNVELPKESVSMQFIDKIDYVDAFKVKLSDNTQKVDSLYMAIFNHAPKWVNVLMGIRNKLVSIFGLDTGDGSKQTEIKSLSVGDKHGVFKVYDIQSNEIIAGEDDKHLDFRVSVLKDGDFLILSTLVHYNSGFGKFYFFIIKRFHKVVVKGIMRKALKQKRI